MNKKLLAILILIVLILPGCALIPDTPAIVRGSGNITSETRAVTGVTSVSLEGSANVKVAFGPQESVLVTAEENIVPLIETNVQNHQLIIKTKPNVTYSTTKPVQVDVTLVALDSVEVSGSGNIDVAGITGDVFHAKLPGSGTITLSGSVNSVDFTLGGSGNIKGDQLKAKNGKAVITGSGNITLYASDSLDATINGSGSIRYSGSPAKIEKSVVGSGSITE